MCSSSLATFFFHPLAGDLAMTLSRTWNTVPESLQHTAHLMRLYTLKSRTCFKHVSEVESKIQNRLTDGSTTWLQSTLGFFLGQSNKMLVLLALSHAKWHQMREESVWLPQSRTRTGKETSCKMKNEGELKQKRRPEGIVRIMVGGNGKSRKSRTGI